MSSRNVSVIMPARNASLYIDHAIRSTLRALSSRSELLVIDDHSEDSTISIVRQVRDRRLKLIESSGSGVAAALNCGIGVASRAIIGRMDADDICLPWRFALQSRALKGADFVFGNYFRFTGSSRRLKRAGLTAIDARAFRHALLGRINPVAHPTMLCRAATLRELGGYANGPAEDLELWLRAAATGHELVRIGAPVLLYREHANQVTSDAKYAEQVRNDGAIEAAFLRLVEAERSRLSN